MGPIQTLDEFLSLLFRRKLLIAALTLLGAVLATLFALSRPQMYEAISVIQVQSPVVQEGADSTRRNDTAANIQAIQQRLTTRESLLAMAERHALFPPGLPEDQQINILRNSVTFQNIAGAGEAAFGSSAPVSALMITARFGSAAQAARLANDFAQGVLDLSVERQSTKAKETLDFFATEDSRVAGQIATLEAEIAAYKNANLAALENDGAAAITALDTDLRRIAQDLLAVQSESTALQAKERLRETDRRRIEALAAQEAVLQRQSQALTDQRAAIEARVAQSPEVERTLSAYDRQLQQLQGQYTAITARRTEAETVLRLEQENRAEHFTLLERAVEPPYPAGGGRKKLAIAGTIGALVASIGLAFVLDLMNPVLRSAAQMQREVDIRPVIVLPDLHLRPARPLPLLHQLWQRLRELPLAAKLGL